MRTVPDVGKPRRLPECAEVYEHNLERDQRTSKEPQKKTLRKSGKRNVLVSGVGLE